MPCRHRKKPHISFEGPSASAFPGGLVMGLPTRGSPPRSPSLCIPTPSSNLFSQHFVTTKALAKVIGSLPACEASLCPAPLISLIFTRIHSPLKFSLPLAPQTLFSLVSPHMFLILAFHSSFLALSLNCWFPLSFFGWRAPSGRVIHFCGLTVLQSSGGWGGCSQE